MCAKAVFIDWHHCTTRGHLGRTLTAACCRCSQARARTREPIDMPPDCLVAESSGSLSGAVPSTSRSSRAAYRVAWPVSASSRAASSAVIFASPGCLLPLGGRGSSKLPQAFLRLFTVATVTEASGTPSDDAVLAQGRHTRGYPDQPPASGPIAPRYGALAVDPVKSSNVPVRCYHVQCFCDVTRASIPHRRLGTAAPSFSTSPSVVGLSTSMACVLVLNM